jgi:hypothetical protein
MVDARKAAQVTVAIAVGAILAALLLPVAINAMAGTETVVLNQSVGETSELQPGLNATLDSVSVGVDASYTLNASGTTSSVTVAEGASQSVTVGGATVNISVQDTGQNSATAEFESPTTYSWGSAGSLWNVIPVIIVLGVFLFFVGVAVSVLR